MLVSQTYISSIQMLQMFSRYYAKINYEKDIS